MNTKATNQLALYDSARHALAECHRVDEVKQIRDNAIAAAAYAKQAKDSKLIEMATEIRKRAERKVGELLKQMAASGERAGQGHYQKSPAEQNQEDNQTLHSATSDDSPKTLAEIGVSRTQSSRWQGLADLLEDEFEATVELSKRQAGASVERAEKPAPPAPRTTPAMPIYVRPNTPESIYENLPSDNSIDEAERRLKAWERSDREAWDDAQGKAARAAAPIVPSTSAPGQRYGVIYADMDNLAGLKATDINAIAEADAVLFLWSPPTALPAALEAMAAAGFTYRDQFVWGKDKAASGKINRNKHEPLLVGTRGKVPSPAPETRSESLFYGKATERGAKPPITRHLIEKAYPSLTRVELNAKSKIDGWATLAGAPDAVEVDDNNPFGVAAE
jgi:N6-adenosine-specific RNA methylase IME4